MNPRIHFRALLALALCCSAIAAAQVKTIYRCGPDGRQYSQTPCPDGRELTVEDSRSAEQQRAAKDVAKRDAAQADKLAAERREREASATGQQAAGIKPPEPAASTAKAKVKPKNSSRAKVEDPNMSPVMRAPPAAPTR